MGCNRGRLYTRGCHFGIGGQFHRQITVGFSGKGAFLASFFVKHLLYAGL